MTVSSRPPAMRRRSLLALLLVGAFAFLYLRTFLLPATPFVSLTDQLLFFSRAVRLVQGQVLYRDVFELVTPGTELVDAAVLRLFGMHSWLIQACTVAFGMAAVLLMTHIAGKFLRGPVILLPALIFLAFDFSTAGDLTHHWYSTLFVLAATSALLGSVTTRGILAAGALCAVATLFTQTQGGLSFLALLVYLVWFRHFEASPSSVWTRIAPLLLSFVLVLFSVLGYYILRAGFHTVFFDLVLFAPRFLTSPRHYLGEIPPMLHSFTGILRIIPALFIFAINPYIYVIGFYKLWRTRNQLPLDVLQKLVLLHLVGVALFLAVAISGLTLFRIGTVSPPAILILTWLLSHRSPRLRLARLLLSSTATLFAIALVLHRQMGWHAVLDLPTGRTAFFDRQAYGEFQWLAQRTHPSDLFFNDFAIGFYLSLKNPTASEFISYNDYTRPEQVSAAIRSLQQYPPQFIVLMPVSPTDTHDHAASFRLYVHNHYHLAESFALGGGTRYEEQLWKLNSSPGE